MQKFRLDIPDSQLDDLRERLARTRWPEGSTIEGWNQGVPLDYAKELCAYWAQRYDWRRCEAELNTRPMFRTGLDGGGDDTLMIHFLHVRSPHANAMPLLLTHGWPGSVVEFLGVIDALTDPPDPADAFHLVIPSLPGYGFSDRPSATGWDVQRIARAWAQLMAGLGYRRYGAQGGDWGSMITTALAQHDHTNLVGVHLNMPIAAPDESTFGDLTPKEQQALEAMAHYSKAEAGYSTQQATRPQTLGYGLVDSPAAQCAWIAEKFWAWTDCDGHPENVLSKDQMLDNVGLYWFPATGASSARLYWESFHNPGTGEVFVPTGITVFPHEIIRLSERWAAKRFVDIRSFTEADKGGHFAAFEQPAIFVDEVRGFFRLVR
jgi:pimeloyl-ACP methyl ester carboxylesterase